MTPPLPYTRFFVVENVSRGVTLVGGENLSIECLCICHLEGQRKEMNSLAQFLYHLVTFPKMDLRTGKRVSTPKTFFLFSQKWLLYYRLVRAIRVVPCPKSPLILIPVETEGHCKPFYTRFHPRRQIPGFTHENSRFFLKRYIACYRFQRGVRQTALCFERPTKESHQPQQVEMKTSKPCPSCVSTK